MSENIEEIYGESILNEVREEYKFGFAELEIKIEALLQGKIGKELVETLKSATINLERNKKYIDEINSINSSKSVNLTPRQKSLLILFWYLWATEGIFSEIIEIISILLMQDHHDIYNPNDLKFVRNYKELEKIDLSVKMQFVKEHGFEFLCDCIDRKFRNSIAHLDIMVNDDGSIVNIKTGEKIPHINKLITRLMVACLTVLQAINKNLGKFLAE
jgi:hypothetical protein